MNKVARDLRWTFEEFCERIREDQKADLIQGAIYIASPENTDSNDLISWVIAFLRPFVRINKLGRIFFSRVAFRLDNDNAPEPDLAFVKTERLSLVERGRVMGPPDLAMEFVSPDSIERDYETKRALYQQFKVEEYWIIDEMEQRVTLLRLNRQGIYREIRPRGGELHSQVVPGFWLRLEWLWQDPLPLETEILQQLLGQD
jgi:Uma2 family endonuclease